MRFGYRTGQPELISEVGELAISEIVGSISPRIAGEDVAHTELLARSYDVLPPILVHRASMRVIDGTHRVRAATLAGKDVVRVRYFDGTEEDAFLLSVRLNIAHGLPLSLADRRAAARRMLRIHPEWSDRKVGLAAGLDHKTVGSIRRDPSGEIPQLAARQGRDGRVRPVRNRSRPRRSPAKATETEANSTGHDSGEAPAGRVSELWSGAARGGRPRPERGAVFDREAIIASLKADPSLRFSEAGRMLIRWLDASPRTGEELSRIVDQTPEHCLDIIAALAACNAEKWSEIEAKLNSRKRRAWDEGKSGKAL
ncbi:ParB/RepB/Spo0J family partition protein [Nocardia sp. NPDC004068]|uniref:ParB/RepB/Spo0J family partition protein n=1 Tax=Nocardia sp. NPDC004068 TaxID=3364303 RepID=UPI0036C1FBB6